MGRKSSVEYLTGVVENNMNEAFVSMAELSAGQVYRTTGAVCYFTGVPQVPFNGIIESRFGDAASRSEIASILGLFKERKLPGVWWITPSTMPANLGELLMHHGLCYAQYVTGMTMEMDKLVDENNTHDRGKLEIKMVDDDRMLRLWIRTFIQCFGFAERLADSLYALVKSLSVNSKWRHFLGQLNGVPVATSSLFLAEESAAPYHVGIVPQARRRGIGTSITLAPLQQARKEGYDIATVQSSIMGISMYKKMGFQERCLIHRYVMAQ